MINFKNYEKNSDVNGNDLEICKAMESRLSSFDYDSILSLVNEVAKEFVENDEKKIFDISYKLYKADFCSFYIKEELKCDLDNKCSDLLEALQLIHYHYSRDIIYQNFDSILNNFILNYFIDTDDIFSEIINNEFYCETNIINDFDIERISLSYDGDSLKSFIDEYKDRNRKELIEAVAYKCIQSNESISNVPNINFLRDLDYLEFEGRLEYFYINKEGEERKSVFEILREESFKNKTAFISCLIGIINSNEFKLILEDMKEGCEI